MNRRSHVEARSRPTAGSEYFETVIIGGGQAGLSVGYHLKKQGRPFVVLDANERIGDAWRKRWDLLRLFTPARYSGLTGWRFPAPAVSFPTKDEMADYLESYATRFDLPVRTGVKVDGLFRARINLPVLDEDGRPLHERGVVVGAPGLYFVGLLFQYAASSDVLPGVGRDAEYIAMHIAEHIAFSREPNERPAAHVLTGARPSIGGEDQVA